jgi:molybdopterin molybdotransferase
VSDLISITEARRRVLEAVTQLGDEPVALDAALGRVLAEDVTSPTAVPPFDSSGMDGYAVATLDGGELEVIGEARAGHPWDGKLGPGAAVRISTGALVPEGAAAVVPVEQTTALRGGSPRDGVRVLDDMDQKRGHDRISVPEIEASANIRRAGEDIPLSAVVLRRGTRLGPAELGVAASIGRAELRCARQPRVAVLITGDELTPPGRPLGPGRIYGSNGFALGAQVERAGALLAAALDDADVVLVSGGVSVGPHDHVKAALRDLGVEERFWGVRLRPGKPTWFGTRGEKLAFGLPGNPVSAMVTFHLFARPALAALQGAAPDTARPLARLGEPIARNPQREQAIRVRLVESDDGLVATPTTGAQGSHVLTSMLGADALAFIAPGEGEVPAGQRVEVELL